MMIDVSFYFGCNYYNHHITYFTITIFILIDVLKYIYFSRERNLYEHIYDKNLTSSVVLAKIFYSNMKKILRYSIPAKLVYKLETLVIYLKEEK